MFRLCLLCIIAALPLITLNPVVAQTEILVDKHLPVGYSFDDGSLEVGPDTIRIYQNTRGKVGLSQTYKYSGYRSVKIEDVAGNKDFPELQGYFKTLDNACYCNYLKLADIYHIKGDQDFERLYRQKIYGYFEEAQ